MHLSPSRAGVSIGWERWKPLGSESGVHRHLADAMAAILEVNCLRLAVCTRGVVAPRFSVVVSFHG